MYWLPTALLVVILLYQYRTSKKVNCIMAQVDELNEKLNSINTVVGNVADDVAELKRQLEEANDENDDVDLSESIALADTILSRLTNLDDSTPGNAGPVE